MHQRTIAREAVVEGIGLHSGRLARVVLRPAPAGNGIVFRRVDLAGSPPVRASLDSVGGTDRGVTLRSPVSDLQSPVSVATVEHLLSAAYGLGIDNLAVDVEGEELPAGDGSAIVYVKALREAGVVELDALRSRICLEEAVWAKDDASCIVALPFPRLKARYIVELPTLGVQVATFDAGSDRYEEAIAPARTWGFLEEAERLRQQGLALGASEENVLVLSHQGYVSTPRFPEEPARHKILDLLGALALLGGEVLGEFLAVGGGHTLHVALARKILEQGKVSVSGPS
ncbi:MAG: UDP-3-O-acyl-N-acetylglucosamine deacetylase [Armatimonadota bacterium]|nr:UDP-3-O-acyl-N-acetylglucosamine deacetylase [Armatimonadota bacterium]MDR5702746.1 UDP-3-O-acyl-N-acetylglucosamine deacetylase [Armatimonadota bacterium]MDR7435176.1 UDP-3-O-acyl-N-acetylglucosamine deacetylase [Armatimonadota bacterium]